VGDSGSKRVRIPTVMSPYNRPQRAQRGSRGIALHILDLGAWRGWVVSTTPRPLYPRERPVPIIQEAGWAPGPVWTCAENLAPTGIRSPDCPAHSQSLYRLSYSAHCGTVNRDVRISCIFPLSSRDGRYLTLMKPFRSLIEILHHMNKVTFDAYCPSNRTWVAQSL
jgi:hypothetical protein